MSPFDVARYERLLEGLEINEVNITEALSNKDFRIDSDFWTKVPKQNPDLPYTSIGSILKTSQYGISIEMNENNKGYPIYRMNEIHNMLCDFDVNKCADIDTDQFNLFSLNDRDVLFNRTNSYEWVGRTGLFKNQLDKKFVFASYLVRFVPDEKKVLPEYLVAFLSSTYGIWDIRRRARHSINQTNVNPEEVKEIQIPLLNQKLQGSIRSCFDRATRNLLEAKQLFERAEITLLHAIGLENWQAPEPLSYVRNSHDAFAAGRLDAEHFQPKFSALLAHIEDTGQAKDLGSVLSTNQRGKQPVYADTGLPVVNSKHVLTGEVRLDSDNRYAAFDDRTLLIQSGDVLINGTGVGTIGRSAPYLHSGKAIPDNHVTILRPEAGIDPIYLSVFLNSQAGQLQVSQRLHGSSGQIELYPNDIAQFKVWVAPEPIQQEIRKSVLDSFQQNQRAIQLLDAAKRAVEISIEKDESAAMSYLKECL